MSVLQRSAFQGHPFHLVSPSPWPLFTCISLLTLTTSLVSNIHGFEQAGIWLPLSLLSLIASMSFWFRDVISEGTYLGNHTLAVQKGLNMGVALFIVSEALFFLAIFWAYFHSALSPTVELGGQWPPIGIEAINAFELPLLNTVLLLASGVTVTYAHHCLIQGNRNGALYGGLFTIILALVFTAFQGVEYNVSSFTISDGAFGSCFYFGTGLIGAPHLNTNKMKDFPFWITGFCDAEGSFSIRFAEEKKRRYGVRISPIFSIELHLRDKPLLEIIKSYFGVGTIIERIRDGKPSAIYSVQSIVGLNNIIIPHFLKYPLLTQKSIDFHAFSQVVYILIKKDITREKVLKILYFKSSMKKGISPRLLDLFPDVKLLERRNISTNVIPSSAWLVGFIEGDGNFYIKVSKTKYGTLGIIGVFSISQHSQDKHLMNLILTYLGCGKLEMPSTRPNIVNFVVYRLEDILYKIIPFMNEYYFLGIKRLDFEDFSKVIFLMKEKKHLTKEGQEIIVSIKKGMNSRR